MFRAARFNSLAATLLFFAGCMSQPLVDENERELRRAVAAAAAREVAEAQAKSSPRTITREPGVERLEIAPAFLPELQGMAGPQSYSASPLDLGEDLLGGNPRSVSISLERAIKTAVANNIAVQFARIAPAVTEAQVLAAEAAFDWSLFSNLTWTNTDSPRTRVIFGTTPSGAPADVQQSVASTIGLRRTLIGGGRLTVQQELTYLDASSPGQRNLPDPGNSLAFTVQFDQPLLRNAGSENSQAEIRVARNAERNSIQTLKRDLIRIAADTEKTYWALVQAKADLLILTRLLERGTVVQRAIKNRGANDADRAQIADATARVERRKSDVLRARTQIRTLSDRLKSLMNDPDLPVGGETIILPSDDAMDQPVTFSLLESMRAAVQFRPEVQQSLIGIDDASIRRMVADNQRLPDLSIRLQTKVSELQTNTGEAYREITDFRFVDYIAGLVFEQPLGNRRAEAEFRRRSLERTQTIVAYRNTVKDVIGEVKTALDRVVLNYQLIEQTRTGRLAATDSLRVLELQTELTKGITPERLDLQLGRQEQLSSAERDEIAALVEYNSAITDLFAAMGTLLERDRIHFIVPTAEDVRWDLGRSALPSK